MALEDGRNRHAVLPAREHLELLARDLRAHLTQDVLRQVEVLDLGVAERSVKVKEHGVEALGSWHCSSKGTAAVPVSVPDPR